jgi:hypothetical protein
LARDDANDEHAALFQKVYGRDPENETRYSPAKVLSTFPEVIRGEPEPKHV